MIGGEKIGLEEVVSNFENIILDTSSIGGYLGKSSFDFGYEKGREKVFEDNHELYKRILEYLDKDKHIFITKKVFDELSGFFKYSYSKNIKVLTKISHRLPNYREQLEFHRRLNGFVKDLRKLVHSFETNLGILNLSKDQGEIYETLQNSYDYLIEEYKLSDTDFDLLLSNFILAGKEGSCALISNDLPMAYSYNKIMKELNLSNGDLGFFLRMEDSKLQKFYPNFNS